MAFAERKHRILADISTNSNDRSSKGSLDKPAVPLINYLNSLPHYVTTSSCSGRHSLFMQPVTSMDLSYTHRGQRVLSPPTEALVGGHESNEVIERSQKAKGVGKWIFVKHSLVASNDLFSHIVAAVSSDTDVKQLDKAETSQRQITYRVEPFILHVECEKVEAAQELLSLAVRAGFRESGISIGKKKIMCAIRTTANSLELPLFDSREEETREGLKGLLVSKGYLDYLTQEGNEKFRANDQRREQLEASLRAHFSTPQGSPSEVPLQEEKKEPSAFSSRLRLQQQSMVVEASAHSKEVEEKEEQLTGLMERKCDVGKVLNRWGHTATIVGDALASNSIYVFGGFGEGSAHISSSRATANRGVKKRSPRPCHRRLNDLVVLEAPLITEASDQNEDLDGYQPQSLRLTGVYSPAEPSPASLASSGPVIPAARVKHSAALLTCKPSGALEMTKKAKKVILWFGGRASPIKAFSDFFLLDLSSQKLDQLSPRLATVEYLRPIMVLKDLSKQESAAEPQLTSVAGRWGHTGSEVFQIDSKDYCVVFGGRNLDQVFNETLLVSLTVDRATVGQEERDEFIVEVVKPLIKGKPPSPRFNHAACVVSAGLVIHGGYADPLETLSSSAQQSVYGILGDLHLLSIHQSTQLDDLSWIKVSQAQGPMFSPRFSHELLCLTETLDKTQLLVFGGFSASQNSMNSVEVLCCQIDQTSLDELSVSVSRSEVLETHLQPSSAVFLNHKVMTAPRQQADQNPTKLFVLGGGVLCFSFGFCFNLSSAFSLTLIPEESAQMAGEASETQLCLSLYLSSSQLVKKIKTRLELAELYDKSRRIKVLEPPKSVKDADGSRCFELPIKPTTPHELSIQLAEWMEAGEVFLKPSDSLRHAKAVTEFKPLAVSEKHNETQLPKLSRFQREVFQFLSAKWETLLVLIKRSNELNEAREADKSGSELRLLESSIEVLKGVPRGIEKLSDVLLFHPTSFEQPLLFWMWLFQSNEQEVREMRNELFELFCSFYRASRIIKVNKIDAGMMRKSRAVHLYTSVSAISPSPELPGESNEGNEGNEDGGEEEVVVEVKQNGVVYCLDLLQLMFSKGNIGEKLRVGRLSCSSEVVVDLYAGVGYFSLQFLKHSSLLKLYLCEVNPIAIKYLKMGLQRNKIDQTRYEVVEGDNRETVEDLVSSRGVQCDRINMGIVPTADRGLPLVIKLINKDRGGMCHVHGVFDVKQKQEQEPERGTGGRESMKQMREKFGEEVASKLRRELASVGEVKVGSKVVIINPDQWEVKCVKVVKVKNYAPQVEHLVADIQLRPLLSSSSPPTQPMASHDAPECCSMKEEEKTDGRLLLKRFPWPTSRAEARRQISRTAGCSSHCLRCPSPMVFSTEFAWRAADLSMKVNATETLREKEVSVHVSKESRAVISSRIDFTTRNFTFEKISLSSLLALIFPSSNLRSPSHEQRGDQASQETQEKLERLREHALYLRAVGKNFRKSRACFWEDYGELLQHDASGVSLPFFRKQDFLFCPPSEVFSSVFRVGNAGLNLWTHYDVYDNVLFQLAGRKRVVLFPPSQVGNLYFKGSTSRVLEVQDYEDGEVRARVDREFPKFRSAFDQRVEVLLSPGEALFIPALWPHNVKTVDPLGNGEEETGSVAVNVFFKSPDVLDEFYVKKDLYGNRDPSNVEKASAALSQVKHLLLKEERQQQGHRRERLPQRVLDFYARKLSAELEDLLNDQ